MTIHSTFDMNIGDKTYIPLSDESLAKFRNLFSELKLIILDEMSMVSSDMLYKIHQRLTDILQNSKPFGGVSIVLVGDLLQIKPIGAFNIFAKPDNYDWKMHFEADSLWAKFEPVILKKNLRQKDLFEWTETLGRIRWDKMTEEDIKTLKSRVIRKTDKRYPHSACHIFYTKKECKAWNETKLNKLPHQLYEIGYVGAFPKGYEAKASEKDGTIDGTPLMMNLQIKKEARVMVVMNVDVSDSIVNGSMGQVVDIVVDESNPATVKCIVVKFDNPDAGEAQRKLYPQIAEKYKEENGTPIMRKKMEYHLPKSWSSKRHAAKGTVVQFPLKLAFALTGHKMQVSNFYHFLIEV